MATHYRDGRRDELGGRELVPDEFRSSSPQKLRELAHGKGAALTAMEAKLLVDAAAEIEGGEEAYGVLVETIRELRLKLKSTEANLRSAFALIPQKNT